MMEPIEIKHAIERAGYTQTDIARMCKRSPQMVNRVVLYGETSHRVRTTISKATGIPLTELWPDYYVKKAS